jgi:hypothetical protein
MTPQTVDYDVRPIYDALDNVVAVVIVYGTRAFTWDITGPEAKLIIIY